MTSSRMFLCILTVIGNLILGAYSPPALCAGLPVPGDTLPALLFQTPASEKDKAYLGVQTPTFRFSDISGRLVVFEVMAVYCPICYRQAPLFSTLFNRIEKSKLRGQVKMLGLAAGGNAMEIEYLNKQGQYSFPIIPDPWYAAHKLLGEPRTPFTMIVDPQGKVLFAHLGVIEDIDAFFKTITDLAR